MRSSNRRWLSLVTLVGYLGWCAACEKDRTLHGDHDHDQGTDHGYLPAEEHVLVEEHVHAEEPDQAEEPEHQHDEATHLDPKTLEQIGAKTAEIKPVAYAPTMKIPGEIRIDPDRKVIISAPVGARVLSLDVPPHATVRAGQRMALLELADTDIRHQQIRAVEIRTELLAARTERNRTRAYLKALESGDKEVAAEKRRVKSDLEVQQARVRSRESALEAVLASLKLAGLSQTQLNALEKQGKVTTRISLHAPRLPSKPALEVAARPVQAGQTISAGTKIYELVALDRLQVVGEAFEADLPLVRKAAKEGLPVGLLFPATRRRLDDLKIYTVEGALDGSARIVHFFMWLPNRKLGATTNEGNTYLDWEFRAGERVQILVPEKKAEPRFVLPIDALVTSGGRQWIFRECEGGCDRVAVRVEAIDERRAIIPLDGGLNPGDRVVVSGALQVHLSLQRPDKDTGHGHRH